MNTYWLKIIRKRFDVYTYTDPVPDSDRRVRRASITDHKNKVIHDVNLDMPPFSFQYLNRSNRFIRSNISVVEYIIVGLLHNVDRWHQHVLNRKEHDRLRAYKKACLKYNLQQDCKKR